MVTRSITRRVALKSAVAAVAGIAAGGCSHDSRDSHDATARGEIHGDEKPRPEQAVGNDSRAPEQRADHREPPDATTPSFALKTIAAGADGPGIRSRHCLIHDQAAKATILFGGVVWKAPIHFCSDTWQLQNGKWSPVASAQNPSARQRAAMVYDKKRGHGILFGGQDSQLAQSNETWLFSRGEWRQWQAGNGDSPQGRCGHALAYDETAEEVLLYGGVARGDHELGDTWAFDGSAWRVLAGEPPPARRYAAFAYDPQLKGCVLHGGSIDDAGRTGYGDAWLLKNGAWRQLDGGLVTEHRDDHGLAYHQAAKKLIMQEGLGGKPGLLLRKAGNWQLANVAPRYPRHQCSPLAWNDELNGLIFHGGELGQRGRQFDTTWLLQLAEA